MGIWKASNVIEPVYEQCLWCRVFRRCRCLARKLGGRGANRSNMPRLMEGGFTDPKRNHKCTKQASDHHIDHQSSKLPTLCPPRPVETAHQRNTTICNIEDISSAHWSPYQQVILIRASAGLYSSKQQMARYDTSIS
jgi:hypothetical protein